MTNVGGWSDERLAEELEAGAGIETHTDKGRAAVREAANRLRTLEEVRGKLEEIREGKGAYSRSALEHAENTVEAQRTLAEEALDLLGGAS